MSMSEQIFFCFGPPKSGTTFLQRTLNLHPDISCSSEHQFDFLLNQFQKVLEQYDHLRKVIDTRTGGQGVIPLSEVVRLKLFKVMIEE